MFTDGRRTPSDGNSSHDPSGELKMLQGSCCIHEKRINIDFSYYPMTILVRFGLIWPIGFIEGFK